MREVGELSSIFNQVLQLCRALLEDKGYVFSVNLDLLKRSLIIQVMEKVREPHTGSAGFSVFYTVVRPVGNSPFATTIPEEIAEAMGLEPSDRISWLPIDSGAFITKAKGDTEGRLKNSKKSRKEG
jgi:antitoxin component of MazEF toxin-antitoxin module